MIVRSFPDRLELITQPDHARLARAIMDHCVPLANEPRRDAILLAVLEHDSGWAGPDAAPTVNPATGSVCDFINAPAGVRQAVWTRSVAALEGHPWAAALVAQHALTVYDRFRSESEWTPFFDRMETARAALLRSAGLPLDRLVADYVFVRLADLISLAFCSGSIDEQRFGAFTVRLRRYARGRHARRLRRGGDSVLDRSQSHPEPGDSRPTTNSVIRCGRRAP